MRLAHLPIVIALALAASASGAEDIRPLFHGPLPQSATTRDMNVVRVDFAPGAIANPHRHGSAFVYAYVLSGVVESQLEGRQAKVYHVGESWSEPPGAHHVLTRNASPTEAATLLVVFISEPGQQLKTDDPAH